MKEFFGKLMAFMQGRYGNDKLNTFILIVAGVLYLINLFVRNIILVVIILLLITLVIVRALSKNVTKRLYENRRFVDMYTAIGVFCKHQYLKVRDFKTHRYVKCPRCKAQLRLKKRRGKQHIRCPKCGSEFEKNILF